ncbi:MAG: glycoside hydrolase family 127 protein, partial [Planctomycetes bacterium]|nr:glycoside hydrolase family 127 protein [Planctomycetota bacterium]
MNYGDGLYGGQFVAGMYAEAFFEDDPRRIIEAGLACIPARSQYAETIRDVLRWHKQEPKDWQATWQRIEEKYQDNMAYRRFSCNKHTERHDGNMDFNIDAKINGAYIVMGLLYGEGNLDKTIVISMRCGQDSDCNPSNAGGILFTTLGMKKLPSRFVSALDRSIEFSHTAYDFDALLDVCEKLTRQAVERSGGWIEKDASGKEVFVIPVTAPKPSSYETCWAPGPIANSRFTEAEMTKINPPPEPQRSKGGSAQRIDISKAVAAFAPGWAVRNCGKAMEPGLRKEWGGRKNVLATHPLNEKTPCILSRSVAIPSEKKASLELSVCNDNRGDWVLVVQVDKQELLHKTIGSSKWQDISIDLSGYAGKTIDLEIWNQANGWKFEGAFWSRIAIETEAENAWQPLPSMHEKGLLGERIDVWRQGRMWYMVNADDDYLLSGFESRPGTHPWQGEHFGKWLHAATLAYEQTGDKKLLKTMQEMVERLLATQDENGYMGTYGADHTFMAKPENVSLTDIADDINPLKNRGKQPKPKSGWDTWTFRYNIYGLLTYEQFHPDTRIVEACEKMADLLIEVYGQGKADLTKYGTRMGISATTLLESIMMLYQRTHEERFLKFAEHIVAMSENNPKLRLMGNMLENRSVVYSGEGKAYQLMANLLGYCLLYESTGDERYLKTAQNGWENIKAHHLYVTGGPWSRKMDYNGNRECFALPRDFDPGDAVVETCSVTTWIQLNLHLLEATGQARYAAEAQRAVFNSLMAAQAGEGIDWCYFVKANQASLPFQDKITCCASSGPRALEMFSHYLIGEVDGGISLTSLVPCGAVLPKSCGGAKIKVTGDYPLSPDVGIRIEAAHGKEFAIEFREPADSRLTSARINGKDIALSKNDRGYYSVSRAWKTGDEIAIKFEYLLKAHVEAPEGGRRWVAFTYGPWALAQKITGDNGENIAEPFVGKDVSSKTVSKLLEPHPVRRGTVPGFRVKGTKIKLEPYCIAVSKESGARTYFEF